MALAQESGTAESLGVTRATVERVVYLGFEVRVDLRNEATGELFSAQVTRGDSSSAAPSRRGETVYARATRVPDLPETPVSTPGAGAGHGERGRPGLT